jgi:glyoxylase-like metal-dependent hydrolase (beta-lactamase superfamily II)
MRIRKPGKVRDQLWYLGHERSGIYLVEGHDESWIISGGTSYIVPALIKQLEEFDIKKKEITKLLILHSHFDHVGIVPFFKRCNPDLQIYASLRAWEILRMPKAIETINAFSRSVMERIGMVKACSAYDLDWRNDVVGVAVSEGDHIDLDDIEVQILETPGHSSCSISAYIPQFKALFASDSAGIPYKQTILSSGNSNFTKFQESLEKLKTLEVTFLCADHYGYIVGDEARNFISRSIEMAKRNRAQMEDIYCRTRDVDATAKELTSAFYAENPDYLLPQEISEGVYRQMVRHVAAALEGEA